MGSDTRRNRRVHSINGPVAGVTATVLVFFDNGMAYTEPDLLASDGAHLKHKRKSAFSQKGKN